MPCACHLSRQLSCIERMEPMDSMGADRVPSSDARTSAALGACDLWCTWVRVLSISGPLGNNASSQGPFSKLSGSLREQFGIPLKHV
mmetsp:Transcript_132276/g.423184  ORF Transcript_132276/g.423184 Transcript_132276/m.423184 type:complete len:87 (-) Transcript_132276:140-400(-)